MPIDYQIDPNGCNVVVRISGVVSDPELLAFLERMLKDPIFPEAPRIMWDARDREDVPRGFVIESLVHLLNQYESKLRGGRCALVTSQTATFGMQRMFSLRTESRIPIEAEAFRDLEQAINWLEAAGENGAG